MRNLKRRDKVFENKRIRDEYRNNAKFSLLLCVLAYTMSSLVHGRLHTGALAASGLRGAGSSLIVYVQNNAGLEQNRMRLNFAKDRG